MKSTQYSSIQLWDVLSNVRLGTYRTVRGAVRAARNHLLVMKELDPLYSGGFYDFRYSVNGFSVPQAEIDTAKLGCKQ